MTPSNPTGRVAFITGGASGIGLAVAGLLQRRDMKLALMDLTEPALQAAAAQLGGDVFTVAGDVTQPDDCKRAVAAAVQRFGAIDVCWANAGVGTLAPLRHADPSEWMHVVRVNVFGVLHTVQAALPQLIARRGHIVVSASVASLGHAPGMSAYAASKAAAEAMCDSWRIELAHHGVAVTCLHPVVGDDADGRTGPGQQRLRAAAQGHERAARQRDAPPRRRVAHRRRDRRASAPGLRARLGALAVRAPRRAAYAAVRARAAGRGTGTGGAVPR